MEAPENSVTSQQNLIEYLLIRHVRPVQDLVSSQCPCWCAKLLIMQQEFLIDVTMTAFQVPSSVFMTVFCYQWHNLNFDSALHVH